MAPKNVDPNVNVVSEGRPQDAPIPGGPQAAPQIGGVEVAPEVAPVPVAPAPRPTQAMATSPAMQAPLRRAAQNAPASGMFVEEDWSDNFADAPPRTISQRSVEPAWARQRNAAIPETLGQTAARQHIEAAQARLDALPPEQRAGTRPVDMGQSTIAAPETPEQTMAEVATRKAAKAEEAPATDRAVEDRETVVPVEAPQERSASPVVEESGLLDPLDDAPVAAIAPRADISPARTRMFQSALTEQRKASVVAMKNPEDSGTAVSGQIQGSMSVNPLEIGVSAEKLVSAYRLTSSGLREVLSADPTIDHARMIAEPGYAVTTMLRFFSENDVLGLVAKHPLTDEASVHTRVVRATERPDITVNPLVFAMWNADFDGDAMTVSFDPEAIRGAKSAMQLMVATEGKGKIDPDFFSMVVWGDGVTTTAQRLRQMFSDNRSNPLALTDSEVVGLAKAIDRSAEEGGANEGFRSLIMWVAAIAERTDDSIAARVLNDIAVQNKHFLIAYTYFQSGWDFSGVPKSTGEIVDSEGMFPELVSLASLPANLKDLEKAFGIPVGRVEKKNIHFRVTAGFAKVIKQIKGVEGIKPSGETAEELVTLLMSGRESFDESTRAVADWARRMTVSIVGTYPDTSSDEAFTEWLATFENAHNLVAYTVNSVMMRIGLSGAVLPADRSMRRIAPIPSATDPKHNNALRTQFHQTYGTYTMGVLFGSKCPKSWRRTTLSEFVYTNRAADFRDLGTNKTPLTSVSVFMDRLADLRTSFGAKFIRELESSLNSQFDEQGQLRLRNVLEKRRAARENGIMYSRGADMADLFEALRSFGPDMFYALGLNAPADFFSSELGQRFLQAQNTDQLGGVLFEAEARYRLTPILEAYEKSRSAKTPKDARHWFRVWESECDELMSSSDTWGAIIRAYLLEVEGQSDTHVLAGVLFAKLTMSQKMTELNKLVREDPQGRPRQEPYEVAAELFASPKGAWSRDRFITDLGHGDLLDNVRSAKYRVNAYCETNIEMCHTQVAAAREACPAGTLDRFLRTMKDDPSAFSVLKPWMIADAVTSMIDKTFASSEKSDQEPEVAYMYMTMMNLINAGVWSDLAVGGDFALGEIALDRFQDSPGILVRVLSDPDFSVRVYDETGRTKMLNTEALFGKRNPTEAEKWDWLLAHPRAAMSLRLTGIDNHIVKKSGFAYPTVNKTLAESVLEASNPQSPMMRSMKEFADRPGFYAMVALTMPVTGTRRVQIRDLTTDNVWKVLKFISAFKASGVDARSFVREMALAAYGAEKLAQIDSIYELGRTQERGFATSESRIGAKLTGTSRYLAKDQRKANLATKFIGRGSAASSTAAYAADFGDRANTGSYSSSDVVFISAEGNRQGRIAPDFDEIGRAADAMVRFVTDGMADRTRPYNVGERQVAEFLAARGYVEVEDGRWEHPGRKGQKVALSEAGRRDVRDMFEYQYGQVLSQLALDLERYAGLIPTAAGKVSVDGALELFKLKDEGAMRSYFDAYQVMTAAKTQVSTSVNANESKRNTVLMFLAQYLSPKPCDAPPPVGVPWNEFITNWEKYEGWQVWVPAGSFSPQDPEYWIAVNETTLDAIEATAQDGVLLEDPRTCIDPTCSCKRHRPADPSSNFDEDQSPPLARLLTVVRTLSGEGLNLQAKTLGDDGRDSIVKNRVFEVLDTHLEADLNIIYAGMVDKDPAGAMAEVRAQLAQHMKKSFGAMGYTTEIRDVDWDAIAHILARPVNGRVEILSIGRLNALATAAVAEVRNKKGSDLEHDECIDAIVAAMNDPERIVVDLDVEAIVAGMSVIRQSPFRTLTPGLVNQRLSSVGRDLALAKQLMSDNPEVKPFSDKELDAYEATLGEQFTELKKNWTDIAWPSGRNQRYTVRVVGVVTQTKKSSNLRLAIGPRNAWVIEASSPQAVDAIVYAYKLGLTVLLDGKATDVDWAKVSAQTGGVIDERQLTVPSRQPGQHATRSIIPMFDIRLNGPNSTKRQGAFNAGEFYALPKYIYFYFESAMNRAFAGDSEFIPTKAFAAGIKAVMTGEYRLPVKAAFANMVDEMRRGGSANKTPFVRLATRGEVLTDLMDPYVSEIADDAPAGFNKTIPIDTGTIRTEGSKEDIRFREGVRAYLARFNEVGDDGLLHTCRPDEIIGWMRSESPEGDVRYHPIRLFEPSKKSGAPADMEIESVVFDTERAELVVKWKQEAGMLGRAFKLFEAGFAANKFVARADAVDDIVLENGVKVAGYIAKQSTAGRRLFMKRQQKMMTLMYMARMDPYGYNLAENTTSFPDDPVLKAALLEGRTAGIEMWIDRLSKGDIVFFAPDGTPETKELNAFCNKMARRACQYRVNPTNVFASRFGENRVPANIWFNFQIVFAHGPFFQSNLMRLMHRMNPSICPNGIEDDSRNTLFNRDLQLLVDGEWVDMFGGFHFLDEHYSGHSNAGNDVATDGVPMLNVLMAGGKKLSRTQLSEYLDWGNVGRVDRNASPNWMLAESVEYIDEE